MTCPRKLSSGQNLSDLVFDTDTSKLPKSGPTEQAGFLKTIDFYKVGP